MNLATENEVILACKRDDVAFIKQVVANGDLDPIQGMFQSRHLDRNLIHFAAYYDAANVFSYIIEFNNAKSADERVQLKYLVDNLNETYLHHAARGNATEVTRIGIQEGIGITSGNVDNLTPLEFAALHDAVDFIKEMAAYYGDRFETEVKNSQSKGYQHSGQNLLHMAAAKNSANVAKFLLEVAPELVSSRTRNGYTPLSLACRHDALDVVKLLAEPSMKDVLEAESIIASPFHNAIEQGKRKSALYLASNGFLPERNVISPLAMAVSHDEIEVVQLLIERGHDVHQVNKHQAATQKLQHLAAKAGSLESFKYLLEKGLSMTEEDSHGSTPLDLAIENGRDNIESYIQAEFMKEAAENAILTESPNREPIERKIRRL